MWKVAHPVLPALDIDETVRFYQEKLGFAPALKNDEVAVLIRDSVELHFWKCDDKNIPANTSCRIGVSEIEELHRHCREQGLSPGELETPAWGKIFSLVDLNGNLIWIFEGVPPWSAEKAFGK